MGNNALEFPMITGSVQLPCFNCTILIAIEDILYIQADINYVKIFTRQGKKFVHAKTLKSYEHLLLKDSFLRIHNSFVINLRYFTFYEFRPQGAFIHLLNGVVLPVSKWRRYFVEKAIEFLYQNKQLLTILLISITIIDSLCLNGLALIPTLKFFNL